MGKGGMRWGAGRPGWHVKAEHCRSIDVRWLQREGLLRPGLATTLAWTDRDTGERLAAIGLHAAGDTLTLAFSLNEKPMSQQVPLERTPCHYGGSRPWFNCPRCQRRMAVLYLRASGFACRNCQRVAYASQSDDAIGRTWRRQAKLEAKLGPGWRRPRGMHRQTRERLLEGIFRCEEVRDDALAHYLASHIL